jgi:hypothetical protein
MLGSSNPDERESARNKIIELLAAHSLNWNDLAPIIPAGEAIIAAEEAARIASTASSTTSQSASQASSGKRTTQKGTKQINVLDLVLRLIEDHVALTPEQRMAVALWTLHTYVFQQFTFTPRLAMLSPVRRCGKTTLLVLLEMLTANADRSDNVTAAAIYHSLAHGVPTSLFDEGDNLGIFKNDVLRAVSTPAIAAAVP